ncbi:MAG: Ig-like domain-containing protein [Candidatus Promineifilaceae bacterium]
MSSQSKSKFARNGIFAFMLLVMLLILAVGGHSFAQADVNIIRVNSTSDEDKKNDGVCTLREAVIAANQGKASTGKPGECQIEQPDQNNATFNILLPPGYYTLYRTDNGNENSSATGDLDIAANVNIIGQPNAANLADPVPVVISGDAITDRVFHIISGVVTIENVTIRKGSGTQFGGGIYNQGGTLTVLNSTLTENRIDGSGSGGGLANAAGATTTLSNVTVINNSAPQGAGSGLSRIGGTLVVRNSLLVGNDCSGAIDTANEANNLALGAATCVTNHVASAATNLDLIGVKKLGTTVDYYKLGPNSEALEAGNNAYCPLPDTDQVGRDRRQGPNCDVGAYEGDYVPAGLPTANNDDYSATEDIELVVSAPGVLGNDLANGSATMSAAVVSNPAGTLNLNPNGSFTYTSPRNFVGIDTFTYEVTGDGGTSDPATVTIDVAEDSYIEVTNTCDSGEGSLRWALGEANATAGLDTIIFTITDTSCGSQTIALDSALPNITDAVVIDGFLQDVGPDRTSAFITIDGQYTSGGSAGLFNGLNITPAGQGTTVRGIQIVNTGGSGIIIGFKSADGSGASDNNIIENNVIYNTGYAGLETNDVPPLGYNDGITVFDGTGNQFLGNNIHTNADKEIDLGGDGSTANDPQDEDTGANDLQNFPDLLTASENGDIYGLLNSNPNGLYTLQFFASPSCNSQQLTPLAIVSGGNTVGTDSDGNATIDVNVGPLAYHAGIYSTATDIDGNTSELSPCIHVDENNTVWPAGKLLSIVPGGPAVIATQFLDLPGQSRWYRFPIVPNSDVAITLSNLNKNFDVALFTDLFAAYAEQVSETDVNLNIIGAESAPTNFNPTNFNPTNFNSTIWNPTNFNPTNFNPTNFNPTNFNGAQEAGEVTASYIFAPTNFNPTNFNPTNFNPTNFNPTNFNGNAYSAAQTSSMYAVSINEGTAPEQIQVNSFNSTGFMFIRVTGREAVSDSSSPFTLSVTVGPSACAGLDTNPTGPNPSPVNGDYSTLILVDNERMAALYGLDPDYATMQTELTDLAALTNGVIVNVDAQGRVSAAKAAIAGKDQCPYAPNVLADAIKEVIDAWHDPDSNMNPNLQNLILVGSDIVIPFYRLPDLTPLGQEDSYVPPVDFSSSSEASLRNNYFLTQDNYGSDLKVSIGPEDLFIPNLNTGRLGETPGNIVNQIRAFKSTPVIEPVHSAVTSYDFLADSGAAVRDLLAGSCSGGSCDLAVDDSLLAFNPETWTADELAAVIDSEYPDALGDAHGNDVLYISGHFSANAALAADYDTHYLTTDLLASSADLRGTLMMSPGCHSSYNIVDQHNLFIDGMQVTFQPDWPQALAERGATLIAGTGYQYGDTDFISYSERLYVELARQLRSNDGTLPNIALGEALVRTKQAYLNNTADWGPLDTKSMMQITLYGVPNQQIDMPGQRFNLAPTTNSVIGSLQSADLPGVPGDPAEVFGLQYFDLERNYLSGPLATSEKFLDLTNTANNSTVHTSYLELGNPNLGGPDGAKVIAAGEPVLPLDYLDITAANTTLRGVLFLEGDMREFSGRQPLVSAVTTELSAPRFNFFSNIDYPMNIWNINRFDVLSNEEGSTKLALTPSQYRSTSTQLETTSLRRFDRIKLRLFYNDETSTYDTGQGVLNDPGRSGAPIINYVDAQLNDSDSTQVDFEAQVTVDPSAGMHEVYVTYMLFSDGTPGGAPTMWRSEKMTQDTADTRLWHAQLSNISAADAARLRFVIQAVSGVGQVTMNSNVGRFYSISGLNADPEPTSTTSLQIIGSSTGFATDSAQFQAKLVDENGAPLGNQTLFFGLGSSVLPAKTDETTGVATVNFPLLLEPGTYQLSAWFLGTFDYAASTSATTKPFTVEKQPTSLLLTPPSSQIYTGEQPSIFAKLTDTLQNTGDPIGEKSILFTLTPVFGTGSPIQTSVITNAAGGQAPLALGGLAIPVGVYTVDARFAETSLFAASSAAPVTLTVVENLPPDCSSVTILTTNGKQYIWPAKNMLEDLVLSGGSDPNGDPLKLYYTQIYQDEPVGDDVDGTIAPISCKPAQVRGQRDGEGDGRVYHVRFRLEDDKGLFCEGERLIGITHDNDDLTAIDGGPLYNSLSLTGADVPACSP